MRWRTWMRSPPTTARIWAPRSSSTACLEVNLHSASLRDLDGAPRIMAACIDDRRATMPRSIATLDRLLARELRTLSFMDAAR